MSTRMMGLVWPLALPAPQKAVLVSIADQANDGGECWPSVATLCERTCYGERAVRMALRALEAAGLLLTQLNGRRSNVYVLRIAVLERLESARMAERMKAVEAEAEAAAKARAAKSGGQSLRGHDVPPSALLHGGMTCREGAPHAGQGGTTCPQTIIEPNTDTPHTPQAPLGGLAGPEKRLGTPVQAPVLRLVDWLEQCRQAGVKPVPASDAVFGYAETVGISAGLVALCWREFKRRNEAARKGQRDWRARFRACVEGNWYGLWVMGAGEPARLSSKGEQAQRFFDAADSEADEVAA